MDSASVRTARESFNRCRQSATFLDRFYELFMDSSQEIRDKFADTDFDRQKGVLSDSLFLMLSAAGGEGGFAQVQLSRLAKRHSRNELDIKPAWYELWLECLMKAVAEHDPQFSEDVEAAWRASLRGGIDRLAAGY